MRNRPAQGAEGFNTSSTIMSTPKPGGRYRNVAPANRQTLGSNFPVSARQWPLHCSKWATGSHFQAFCQIPFRAQWGHTPRLGNIVGYGAKTEVGVVCLWLRSCRPSATPLSSPSLPWDAAASPEAPTTRDTENGEEVGVCPATKVPKRGSAKWQLKAKRAIFLHFCISDH